MLNEELRMDEVKNCSDCLEPEAARSQPKPSSADGTENLPSYCPGKSNKTNDEPLTVYNEEDLNQHYRGC